jgi:hypothetical protein
MYRSHHHSGMGNYYDRYSDNTRRSISASPILSDQGNYVLRIYQWLHFYGLLTDEVIIREKNIYFLLFFMSIEMFKVNCRCSF